MLARGHEAVVGRLAVDAGVSDEGFEHAVLERRTGGSGAYGAREGNCGKELFHDERSLFLQRYAVFGEISEKYGFLAERHKDRQKNIRK